MQATRNIMLTLLPKIHSLLEKNAYTVRHGLVKGLKMKGGLQFVWQILPPSKEEIFLLGLDLAGQTVYDIGGFEGILTMFFCRAVGDKGRVITFEPNPVNFRKMLENIKLNHLTNVVTLQTALGRKKGKVALVFHPSEPAQGSIRKSVNKQILKKKGSETIHLQIDSLDNQIISKSLPKPDLVKIDVEGLEEDVLRGMNETIKHHEPKLYLEIHGVSKEEKSKNAHQIVIFLLEHGYSIYHVESNRIVTLSNAHSAIEGHLYAYTAK